MCDSPQQGNLQQIAKNQAITANEANQYAQQFVSPLQTGTLPPAAQALVNQVLQSNLAGNRGTFSRLGLTGSTMEQSAQDQAQQQSLAQTFGIEEDMAKLGEQFLRDSLTGLTGEAQTTQDIAGNITNMDTALLGAIGGFGKAVGMGAGFGALPTGGITVGGDLTPFIGDV